MDERRTPAPGHEVTFVDTTARDGLQNESTVVSTADKVELVQRGVAHGARRLEVASFVSPHAVPQMADAEDVLAGLARDDDVSYAGLVMNRRGLDRALEAGVDEVDVVVVATDAFCLKNQRMTTMEACREAATLVEHARAAGVLTTVTIGAAFGCPFEGEVPVQRLQEVIAAVLSAGPDELALADTIGVAVPTDVRQRCRLARTAAPGLPLRLHLHDTRHTAVANAVAALDEGVSTLDATLGGLGGCPFAPRATGNVALEDLVYAFDRMGVSHGLDLVRVLESVAWVEGLIAHPLPGAILRAGGFPPT